MGHKIKANVDELIKAGVHFGHRSSRWNPKMAPYIMKKSNQIHIIDIKKTLWGLIAGSMVAEEIAGRGEYVLFVGTKRQAGHIIRKAAERCDMPYVSERWLGGLLTNYETIRSRLQRLDELEELERTGRINEYSKKMVSSFRREMRKIKRNLGGVRNMDKLPGLLVIVDPNEEDNAVKDAINLHIPTIAWMDTNANPDLVDIAIPANDDSICSIEVFVREMADAVLRGKELAGERKAQKANKATEGTEKKRKSKKVTTDEPVHQKEEENSPPDDPKASAAPTGEDEAQ